MLSLTRKTEYALVALTALARAHPASVNAREIGERFHLPMPVLTNILNQLARMGVITSTRGPKGGYRLARDACRISLADVIEAIEGNVRLTNCCPDGNGGHEAACEFLGTCPVNEPIQSVHEMVWQVLNGVTLEQMAWNRLSSCSVVIETGDGSGSTAVCEPQRHANPPIEAASISPPPSIDSQLVRRDMAG